MLIFAVIMAVLVGGVMPAGAADPFGPPRVLVPQASVGEDLVGVTAAVGADGTVRGFAGTQGLPSATIWFFRYGPRARVLRTPTPYRGSVLAVAWDGVDATYVVFQQDMQLKIAKRMERTGRYSAATTLDSRPLEIGFAASVVAAAGKWWVVWSKLIVEPTGHHLAMFQRHTLLGTQGMTRISTSRTLNEGVGRLFYANRRLTLVWDRMVEVSCCAPSNLWISTSRGGPWSSRLLTTVASGSMGGVEVAFADGVTYLTWPLVRSIMYADNRTGKFVSRRIATSTVNFGLSARLDISSGRVFVAITTADRRVVLAERIGRTWTQVPVVGKPATGLAVLAQSGKARVIYRTASDIRIRAQR